MVFSSDTVLSISGISDAVVCIYSTQICIYQYSDEIKDYQLIVGFYCVNHLQHSLIRSQCVNTRVDRVLSHFNSMYYGILIMDQTNNETITSIWFKDSSERDTVFQILSSTVSNKHPTINKKAPSFIAIHQEHDEESKIRTTQQQYKEDTSIHLLSNLDLTSKTRTNHKP